jgi:putative Mn2+ efflux pump MntP
MYKRFNELSFIIGLFFFILSLILIVNDMVIAKSENKAALYSGVVFFIFGMIMMLIKNNDNE